MPNEEEVNAVLDVLFNGRDIRWDYELRMRHEAERIAPPSLSSLLPRGFLRRPERKNGMWAMNLFRSHYRDIVIEALEQAEKVRNEGTTAREIYPANAITVDLGGQQWGVEIFVAYSAELIEGFKTVSEARAWIRNEADNYLVGKGLPKGTKVKVIE